MMLLFLIY